MMSKRKRKNQIRQRGLYTNRAIANKAAQVIYEDKIKELQSNNISISRRRRSTETRQRMLKDINTAGYLSTRDFLEALTGNF